MLAHKEEPGEETVVEQKRRRKPSEANSGCTFRPKISKRSEQLAQSLVFAWKCIDSC